MTWLPYVIPAVTAAASYFGAKEKNKPTKNTSSPWGPAQPYIQDVLGAYQNLYYNQNPAFDRRYLEALGNLRHAAGFEGQAPMGFDTPAYFNGGRGPGGGVSAGQGMLGNYYGPMQDLSGFSPTAQQQFAAAQQRRMLAARSQNQGGVTAGQGMLGPSVAVQGGS